MDLNESSGGKSSMQVNGHARNQHSSASGFVANASSGAREGELSANEFGWDEDGEETFEMGTAEAAPESSNRSTTTLTDEQLLAKITYVLKKYGISDDPRPIQIEGILASLKGRDLFVTLATGEVKTLIAIVSALVSFEDHHTPTIIVSPLIALIKDHIRRSEKLVPATSITGEMSGNDRKRIYRGLKEGEIGILHTTSDQLPTVLEELDRVTRIVFDEAHCIALEASFRNAYRNLEYIKVRFPTIPITAMTATASLRVERRIHSQLQMTDVKRIHQQIDRPNLYYEVLPKSAREKDKMEDKKNSIDWIRNNFQAQSGIVYCSSKVIAKEFAELMLEKNLKAGYLHSGVKKGKKDKVQEAWQTGSYTAFVRRRDKADVRFIIHYGMPLSPERLLQETGRSGRDGQAAHCRVYFHPSDPRMAYHEVHDLQEKARQRISKASHSAAAERDELTKQARLEEEDATEIRESANAMMRYGIISAVCRRVQLLDHFGEIPQSRNCGNCDICVDCSVPTRIDISEFAGQAVKILQQLHITNKKGRVPITGLVGAVSKQEDIALYPVLSHLKTRENVECAIRFLIASDVLRHECVVVGTQAEGKPIKHFYLVNGSQARDALEGNLTIQIPVAKPPPRDIAQLKLHQVRGLRRIPSDSDPFTKRNAPSSSQISFPIVVKKLQRGADRGPFSKILEQLTQVRRKKRFIQRPLRQQCYLSYRPTNPSKAFRTGSRGRFRDRDSVTL